MGLQKAHTNLIFSLACLVLESYTIRNVMSCFDVSVLSDRATDMISVAYFDQVVFFSDFHLL